MDKNVGIILDKIAVTPFAGVWIEIVKYGVDVLTGAVTPFAGVWIEISII